MDHPVNRKFLLAARPRGLPQASDWDYVEAAPGVPQEGELLVAVKYLSLDPAMRGWMNEGRSYIRPVNIGEVMRALGLGQVVESRAAGFAVGDYVTGGFGMQTAAVVKAADCTRVDPALAPLTSYLNVLGMTGMTAYFGLFDVGQPRDGETVVVSGAAGGVGATVGQLAKIKGCRVVGIAGGAEKCRFLVEELGFDAAVDYKDGNLAKALRAACPGGINVFFDNVGGEILDACLAQLAMRARIVICGAISQYNATEAVLGPRNYLSLLVNRARMEGMVVFDYADRYAAAAKEMAGWMAEGKLRGREDVEEGFERFPEVFLKLFSGGNFGKLVLKV
jgi:NADPH-dependent curcumin reductase CurA